MERRKAARRTAQSKPVSESEPAGPLSHELLFEAAEAWVRALVALNPERLDDRAFAQVMISDALGPFDAREALEAYEFLRRMGYLEE
jgi:hypothetical protein